MEKMAARKSTPVNPVTTAQAIAAQAKALEQQLKHARGTEDAVARHAVDGRYHVGDEGPTPMLMEAVKRMLTSHPMTFQELLDATGARANRVKGVIMRLQREGEHVVNLGTDLKALWFIPAPEVLERLRRVLRLRGAKGR